MKSVLDEVIAAAVGAVEAESSDFGFVLHRTSATTRRQLDDPAFDHVSATPSGIRIEATTDAAFLDLDLALTRAVVAGVHVQDTFLDVAVDGELRPPVPITAQTLARIDPLSWTVELEQSEPGTYHFAFGSAGITRVVEIWLPTAARTELLDARVPVDARFTPARRRRPRWVHYGSSISQCSEVERPTEAWPTAVARRTGYSLTNMGLAGQCQLDIGVARTIGDADADLISLELGINIVGGDTMRERTFVSAFHGFLDTIRRGAPDTPISVITPILCPVIEDQIGPAVWGTDGHVHSHDRAPALAAGTLSLTRARKLLAHHVDRRRAAGDPNLSCIDGLTLFGAADSEELPDGLHPSTEGYRRIADRFHSTVFGGATSAVAQDVAR